MMAELGNIGTAFMQPILQTQQYVQNEKMLPSEIAQKAAAARYSNAMADRLEEETSSDKKAAALMAAQAAAGGATAEEGSISAKLFNMSNIYAQAGNPTKAAALAAQASQSASHEATARAAEVRGKLANLNMAKVQLGEITKLLGGVTDEASWQAANATFEQSTGQQSPFSNTPYDPKVVEALKASTITEYQKQMVGLRQTAVSADVANKLSQERYRGVNAGIAEENLRVRQQREARLAKAGVKDVGAPSKVEVEAADRVLRDSGLEGEERDDAAFSIASEARSLRKKNPGMSADDATRQAHLAAMQNGSITPATPGKFFGFGGTPGKFSVPLPLPKTKDKLSVGQHYTFPNGAVGEWTKEGWKQVKAGAAAAPSGGGDGNDSEDDSDGDD